ncbi:MAG TPA: CoA pyrophosphatase [Bacteroidales bacterium]|nr:CoA pyrophosphatase [Bacteroidales bacterium]
MDARWVERLKNELTRPLPGIEAQMRLSPPARNLIEPDRQTRESAVMIMLYPVGEEITTVFIKRTEYEGVHSGQVSLPGGMRKKSDVTLEQTALRETFEETGVSPELIQVIGHLTSLHIPVSGNLVFPFVGICENKPLFIPDPFEVKYLIEASLDELTNPSNRKSKVMSIAGYEIDIPYFDIQGDHIWGATAMIMSEFLEVVERV